MLTKKTAKTIELRYISNVLLLETANYISVVIIYCDIFLGIHIYVHDVIYSWDIIRESIKRQKRTQIYKNVNLINWDLFIKL